MVLHVGKHPRLPDVRQKEGRGNLPSGSVRNRPISVAEGSPDNTGTPESSTKGRAHFHFIGSSDTGSISMCMHTQRLTNNPADL